MKQKKINYFQVRGDCSEEAWTNPYRAALVINKLSQIKIVMPALFSRTGTNELTFILRPIKGGWTSHCRTHRDFVTFDVELSAGLYHYCDDKAYGLNVEWYCHTDLERKLRVLHRQMLLTSIQILNPKIAA